MEGAKCAEVREISGEDGGWLEAVGKRVWVVSFKNTRELDEAADANESPRGSERDEHQAGLWALKSPKTSASASSTKSRSAPKSGA